MTASVKIIIKRAVGIFLVIFGIIALILPLVPFAWVAFIGLELLGVRVLFWNKVRSWKNKYGKNKS